MWEFVLSPVCMCVCVWVGFLSETSHPVCEVIRNGGEIWLSFLRRNVAADVLGMHTHRRSHNHTHKHQGKTNNLGKSDSLWCVKVCIWMLSRQMVVQ